MASERDRLLEECSILVYRQISAGWSLDRIRDTLSETNLTADDQDIAFKLGKQRYINYRTFVENTNKNSGLSHVKLGIGWLVFVGILLTVVGWPEHGRYQGRAIIAILAGLGVIGYGIWEWLTARPTGTRDDVIL